MSISGCTVPLYGTCVTLMPVASWNTASAMCGLLPTPDEAQVDLAGIRLRVIHEFLRAPRRKTEAGQDVKRRVADPDDRREIAHPVRRVLAQQDVVHAGPGVGQEQRVAVGIRPRHRFGADDAAGPGPVVDDELLAQRFGQLAGDEPPDDVVRRPGRERNHPAHRPARVIRRRVLRPALRHRPGVRQAATPTIPAIFMLHFLQQLIFGRITITNHASRFLERLRIDDVERLAGGEREDLVEHRCRISARSRRCAT